VLEPLDLPETVWLVLAIVILEQPMWLLGEQLLRLAGCK
jgi:hypothetical protein